MPELPEVETVRRGLEPVFVKQTFEKVTVNRPDLRWPFPDNMADRIAGTTVNALRRRSKYILADLDSGETLLIHLGMSGRIQITGATLGGFYHDHVAAQKHDHVIFDMTSGARIVFNDPRRFGAMDLISTADQNAQLLLRKLGPEPLGNTFHADYLVEALAGKKTPIKSALLDQRIIAGLGNIYVCEALFRAGISPEKLAGKVSKARVIALVPIIRNVLEEAIESGGSSLRDYRQADGELGYFQHSFQVYDREGKECAKAGCSGSVKRIVQSGRSSFFCPKCQR